jgi:hypothetical protein
MNIQEFAKRVIGIHVIDISWFFNHYNHFSIVRLCSHLEKDKQIIENTGDLFVYTFVKQVIEKKI